MLRIAVVGAGPVMQRIHLPSLRAFPEVEVVALADINRELGARVASAFGIPKTYGDVSELLEAERDLQGVVVVAGKQWHASACIPALQRGLPVFTEKPLAATVEQGRSMVAAAKASGARLFVGYMKRYDPAVVEAERRLQEGAFGNVRYARIHDWGGNFMAGVLGVGSSPVIEPAPAAPRPAGAATPPPPPPTAEQLRKWAFDQWIEVWVHDVNLAQGLFGPIQEVVWSREGSPKLALVRCASGADVLLEMGGPQPGGSPWDETVEAFGTTGRFELTFGPPFLRHMPTELRIERSAGVEVARLGYAEAFTEELRMFCRMILTDGQPRTDGEMGLADLEVCARLADAAHPGCKEPL